MDVNRIIIRFIWRVLLTFKNRTLIMKDPTYIYIYTLDNFLPEHTRRDSIASRFDTIWCPKWVVSIYITHYTYITLHATHYTYYTVQYGTTYSLHSTMYSPNATVYSLHSTVYSLHSTVYLNVYPRFASQISKFSTQAVEYFFYPQRFFFNFI